jgi:wyosine [tRNA(Phe)-imidazoG37] synthetase (radical SAM superfamily)
VGPTPGTEMVPRPFYEPAQIVQEVERHLVLLRARGEQVDYLSFVPDGEPTLDVKLGEMIDRLRPLGIPIAVISNGSLFSREDVREQVAKADWVSVKVDAIDEGIWRRINQPHPTLNHEELLEGILAFASVYKGTLATETMLVQGVNNTDSNAEAVGRFVAKLAPKKAYLAVPIRPPAERDVQPPDENRLNRFFQIVNGFLGQLELLSAYEGDAFASTGNLTDDLLAITSVHPLRESAVRKLVERSHGDWREVEQLVAGRQLVLTEFAGHRFYVRRLPRSLVSSLGVATESENADAQ